jgi:hypothetical protein
MLGSLDEELAARCSNGLVLSCTNGTTTITEVNTGRALGKHYERYKRF